MRSPKTKNMTKDPAVGVQRPCSALAARVLAMCKKRNWCLHWTSRGAYLHLEASELIEAIRGKGTSTPKEEAGDVLLVLMSITEAAGIDFEEVIAEAAAKCAKLETLPRYEGEEVKLNA